MSWYHLSAFIVGLSLTVGPAAKGEKLTAEETKSLLFEGPWQIETDVSFNYFLWDPDGTLCVKLFDPQADTCDDTGSWFRNETIVCYLLQWWGKTVNERQGCFQIVKTEPDVYETLDAGGFSGLKFTVVQTI
jgi:hypothetical protein